MRLQPDGPRVLVDESGKLDVTAAAGGEVCVRGLDGAGDTSPVLLADVCEEARTREGVTVQVLRGGTAAAVSGTLDVELADVVEVQDLRRRLAGAVEVARKWRQRAQQAQAEGKALEAEVRYAGGVLVALEHGAKLLPVGQDGGAIPPLVQGLGGIMAAPLVGLAWMMGGVLQWSPWWELGWWIGKGAIVGAVLCAALRVTYKAFGRPREVWRPVMGPSGRYAVRVGREGEVQIMCARGEERSWRLAEEFLLIPEGDRVQALEGQLKELEEGKGK